MSRKRTARLIWSSLAITALVMVAGAFGLTKFGGPHKSTLVPHLLFASIDTMKESMDTSGDPLSDTQIADDINLAASLHPSYITVDTQYEYPDYMQRWVKAIRAAGTHVWFRIHPNQWEDSNGAAGIMTPSSYLAAERAFIAAHAGLFRPDDILDPCPEPENGLYWKATYGNDWSFTPLAPNVATDAFNAFVLDTTAIADTTLHAAGIFGVITSVRSIGFAAVPSALYASTIRAMGRITVDSYPEGTTVSPAAAAAARVGELQTIESIRKVPIVIGEMGYSDEINVDDATQSAVLKAEFNALATLPYLIGVNYWVGAGNSAKDYTRLFNGVPGSWSLRRAAADVSAFYTAHG